MLLVITALTAEQLDFAWEAASVRRLHMWLGYLLFLGLVARFVWGMVGPVHARWGALWHPMAWWSALRTRRLLTPAEDFGHHPLASAVYLVFYGVLTVAAVTGLALAAIDQGQGPLYVLLGHHMYYKPWVRTPHEWLDKIALLFIVAHLAALIRHEVAHKLPMAQSMVSGYQYRPMDENEVEDEKTS